MAKQLKSSQIFVSKNAQGTIEYLVIIAVIVVIALLMVALLTGMFGSPSGQLIEGSTKISQLTGPIGFIESVVDAQGEGLVSLRNNSSESVLITKLSVCGFENSYYERLSIGDKINFQMNGMDMFCSVSEIGTKKQCEFSVGTKTSMGVVHNYGGTVIVECVDDVTYDSRVVLSQNSITLSSPQKYSTISNPALNFNYSANSSSNSSCELIINDLNVSTKYGSPYNSFNYTLPSEATYKWDVNCTDTLNVERKSSNGPWYVTYSITQLPSDITPPVVTLLSPVNHFVDVDGIVDFNYSVTDDSSIQSCELIIGGNWDQTNSVAPFNGFNKVFSVQGIYSWDVNCTDSNNNEGADINAPVDVNYYVAPLPPVEFSGGSGSFVDPYRISDCNQLQKIDGNNTTYYLDKNFVLIADIDCIDSKDWNGGKGFDPIGSLANSFTGSIDGNNHSISNLSITRPDITYGVGLVGRANGSRLSNLKLVDFDIDGNNYVGTLVGYGENITVENVISSGELRYNGQNAGGLIGILSRGFLNKTSFSGKVLCVSGLCYRVDGLVGYAAASSPNYIIIKNSYSNADVNGKIWVGGLVGMVDWNPAFIENCYSLGDTNGTVQVGGLVGSPTQVSVVNSYTVGRVNAESAVYAVFGSSSNITLDNIYWSNNLSNCHEDGNLGCTMATSKSVLYSTTHGVYTAVTPNWTFGNPGTDNNWSNLCNGIGFPPLMFEGKTSTGQCIN